MLNFDRFSFQFLIYQINLKFSFFSRPKTVGHGLGSATTSFPLRLSQRSSSLLNLPTSGGINLRNNYNGDLNRNNFSDKVAKERFESGNPGRSRSSTPPRAFTSHHALCTNQVQALIGKGFKTVENKSE